MSQTNMSFTSDAAHKAVQASLDSITSRSKENGIAGLVFAAVNKDGDIITANASGNRGLSTEKPMTLDTVFWIASCTKMVATIAVMQLVEQGKLSLDDHEQLYELCPELKRVKVVKDDGSLEERQGEITLRMLLSHTAGFGYEFFNEKLSKGGFDVFKADVHDILTMPLVNQPGSRWEYGINIDWAGIALERRTGMSLGDYMRDNIFEPLGLESTGMFLTPSMREQLAKMHQRPTSSDGEAKERDHVYLNAVQAESPQDQDKIFHSAGAGLFSRPVDYVQILAVLLNNGTSPKTNKQILKAATVKEMMENQIPQFPDFGRQPTPAANPEYTNALPEFYPQEGNPPQGWCLSAFKMLEPGPTGHGKNTIWWAGIANLFWWCDVEKGVAGMIAAQIEPFGDGHVMGQWFACETAVYNALSQ